MVVTRSIITEQTNILRVKYQQLSNYQGFVLMIKETRLSMRVRQPKFDVEITN